MSETLAAVPLDLSRVNQAYPVVHTSLPSLDLQQWRRFANRLIRSRHPASGVMTVQQGGYIRGLFCHWQQPNLKHGELLVVESFSVLDMFDPQRAADLLVEAMERIAEMVQCKAIHTALPHLQRPAEAPTAHHEPFHNRGHMMAGAVWCKTFEPSIAGPSCTVTKLNR